MRFTLIKDIRQDRAMKPLLNGLLTFMLLYLLADIYVTKMTLGLFSGAISETLFGNMEEFIDPMDSGVFLEYIHGQIFFMMMILLTLSAVYARLCSKKNYSMVLINTLMISALLSLITLALTYFFNANFLNLYIVTYFLWHSVAFVMTTHALWNLNHDSSI